MQKYLSAVCGLCAIAVFIAFIWGQQMGTLLLLHFADDALLIIGGSLAAGGASESVIIHVIIYPRELAHVVVSVVIRVVLRDNAMGFLCF